MPALQQQIHSPFEASRHIRIVGVDIGTDTAISVRGMRPAVLLVCFDYGFDPGAHGEFAVGCCGAAAARFGEATAKDYRRGAEKSNGKPK
jgi:hypothetical protein